MERIFIEGTARPFGAPSPLALLPALLVHLALVPVALLSFNPPLLENAPPTVVEIAFLEVPEEPEPEPLPPEEVTTALEPPTAVTEPTPAPVVAVPDVHLPQAETRSAEERAAAEALSSYLCVFAEEDERARAECEARQQARALATNEGERVIDESLFTRMAVSLGLMMDPSQVPPVENPAIDPYAPDDTSYENPVNDIRDPIPGVIHN